MYSPRSSCEHGVNACKGYSIATTAKPQARENARIHQLEKSIYRASTTRFVARDLNAERFGLSAI